MNTVMFVFESNLQYKVMPHSTCIKENPISINAYMCVENTPFFTLVS